MRAQENGAAALAEILDNPPGRMILNRMLPDMDGLQVLKHIRADATAKTLPILMLTAKGAKEPQAIARAADADAFITKPFANSDVLAVVKILTDGERFPKS